MAKAEEIRQKLVNLHKDYNKKRKELEKEYNALQDEEINSRLKIFKKKYLGKVIVIEKGWYKEYVKVRDIVKVLDIGECDFEIKGTFIRQYDDGSIFLSRIEEYELFPIEKEKENLLTIATVNELDELYQSVEQIYEKIFS